MTLMILVSPAASMVYGGDEEALYADYSISPEYAARYPHGVIELYNSEVRVTEGGKAVLRLIRMGGTEGRVAVELKAIDISAKYGVDYTVDILRQSLVLSDEYPGTLTEAYLEESGGEYIVPDSMLTDEVYKRIIGYVDPAESLSDEDNALLHGASVDLVSDLLNISGEDAESLVDQTFSNYNKAEAEEYDFTTPYKSPLHELKDDVLGEKTAPNGMDTDDLLSMDSILGNNDENLAASMVYDAAVGASLKVVFEDGQNEKFIVISTFDDTYYEPEEVFSLGICNPEGGAELGEIVGCSVAIGNNDETEESTIGFATSLVEIDSNAVCASVDIVRNGCLNDYARISVLTLSLNADSSKDYLPVDTTSVFLPGEKQKTLIVPLKTSIADQTETKEIGVVLDVEAGSAAVDVSSAVIRIAPMAAARDDITPVYDENKTVDYFTVDVDKLKDSGTVAGLFNDLYGSVNMLGIKKIQINFTVLRNGSDGNGLDKSRKEKLYFGVFGHPAGIAGQVYDAAPGVGLQKGESGTFTFDIGTPSSVKNATWSADQLTFKFYTAAQIPFASYQLNNFAKGSNGMSRDLLKNYLNKYKYYVTVEELTWDDIQIDEVRLYPNKNLYVQGWASAAARNVQAEYREFNGTTAEEIVRTVKYTGGYFDLPQYIFRGFDFSTISYQLSKETAERRAFNVDYMIEFVGTVVKSRGSFLDIDDYSSLLYDDPKNIVAFGEVALIPLIRGSLVGYVTVEDYDTERGDFIIGDKKYCNGKVTSDEWREGDELFLFAYPAHGYKCDKIEITRADGNVEHIAPGEKIMLTRGMSVKPLFYEEDIKITVSWKYPGSFISYQNRETNMAEYAFSASHEFTDNGDGTFTFSNMVPGDIVTLYVLPKNQDDTSAVIKASYLETLSAGEHEIALVTDKGESVIRINILPAGSDENVTFFRFKVTDTQGAVWKKGSGKDVTFVAASNSETVSAVKLDGKTVSKDNYTAVKGYVRTRTGYWTRNAIEGEVRLNNDVRFIPCIGDIYAFEVDDHNMEFTYYLIERAVEESGALVKGKVVTKGGTIKRPNSVDITAANVDVAGIPVAHANVNVLSADMTAKMTVDNVDYYTYTTTDSNGYFTAYLPAYAENLGYCIAISQDDRIYQGVSIFTHNGTTVYVLPHQNPNYQIDRMTVGSDLDTTAIYVTDTPIKLGIHAVIAPGYHAQKLVLRSYDGNGALIKEWIAEPARTEGWTYETSIIPSANLAFGGRLTVELYDQKGVGLGEFDTGYEMKFKPSKGEVTWPQFDPMDSVTLPVLGDVSVLFSLGRDWDVVPKESYSALSGSLGVDSGDQQSGSSDSSGGNQKNTPKLKNYFQISYGAASSIRRAISASKKIKGYGEKTAQERAALILSHLNAGTTGQLVDVNYDYPKDGQQTSGGIGAGTGDSGTGTGDSGTGTDGASEQQGSDTQGNNDDPQPGVQDTIEGGSESSDIHDTAVGLDDPVGNDTVGETGESPTEIDLPGGSDITPPGPGTENDPPVADTEITNGDDGNVQKENPRFKAGDLKGNLNFTFGLSAILSLFVQDGKMYFDCLALYAEAKVTATATQQFVAFGIPGYAKLTGVCDVNLFIYVDNHSGSPLQLTGNGKYYTDGMKDKGQIGADAHISFFIEIGAGVGHLQFMTLGISGSANFEIDWQPWGEGAGKVTLSLDIEGYLAGITAKIGLVKASYGVFRTEKYTGTMDFSGCQNASKFRDKKNRLMSYRDTNSQTELYGSLERNPRGNSVVSGKYSLKPPASVSPTDRVLAEMTVENVIKTVDPALIPLGDGSKVLFLRLDDDKTRGDSDYSALAYSVIDWEGNETEPAYLDNDSTFDFNLKAAQIGDGRVLVVWSDLDNAYSNVEVESVGELLNHADLSYCIFDENGVPGEVKKLTSDYGFEGMPALAYDEETGNVLIAYFSTDYQTEGISLTEDNILEIGNFLYNSYSNVCFKVIDQSGEIIKDYTKAEASYKNYEAENGKGVLSGMRYLNTQIDSKKSQSTITEISAAALDGKAYVVYSVDDDRAVSTDSDRDLYIVVCDLETMEQSAPILLSEEEKADTNPQLITYDGSVLMYWNQNGKLNCGDVVGYLNNTYNHEDYVYSHSVDGVNNMGQISNAATSYTVSVLPGGNLCIIWTDWEETGEGNVAAVYFREYDPCYGTYKDDEGIDHTYGMWGNITKVASVEKGQDIGQVAYTGSGRKMLISYVRENKDDDSNISSCDSVTKLLKGGNRQEMSVAYYPNALPKPGSNTTAAVTVKNLASLPSNKITVKAELIDKDKKATLIDTVVIEDHFESNDKITAYFEDFEYPEDPSAYRLRITSWEDDLDDYPVVNEYSLPYRAAISFSDAALDTLKDGSYAFSLRILNEGNKSFDGDIAIGYVFREGEGDEEQNVFKKLTEKEELKLTVNDTKYKTLSFAVPDELYDDDGICELEVVAYENDRAARIENLYLYKTVKKEIEPSGIILNTEDGAIALGKGETRSLEGMITPFDARSGYRIVYSVDDPSVASVDALGNVKALKEGKTSVTASVVKEQTSLFISGDYMASSGNGAPLSVDEFGIPTGLDAVSEEAPLFTETVEVNVTAESKYQITEGANAKWNKDSGEELTFVSNAEFAKFVSLMVDGAVVDPSNYDLISDGTKIVLKKSFLESLAEGTHMLTIVSTDGNANTLFSVGNSSGQQSPDTGDRSRIDLWADVMIASAALLVMTFLIKRKKKG